MSFAEVERRQFIIQMKQLNKKKEFKSTFADALKGTVTLKAVNDILESKREAYDYIYLNVFKKFGLEHDDLVKKLDEMWASLGDPIQSIESFLKDTLSRQRRKLAGVLGLSLTLVSLNPINFGPIGYALYVQYVVRRKWDGYKVLALGYAIDYAEKGRDG